MLDVALGYLKTKTMSCAAKSPLQTHLIHLLITTSETIACLVDSSEEGEELITGVYKSLDRKLVTDDVEDTEEDDDLDVDMMKPWSSRPLSPKQFNTKRGGRLQVFDKRTLMIGVREVYIQNMFIKDIHATDEYVMNRIIKPFCNAYGTKLFFYNECAVLFEKS